jgi:predicted RNase H-like HicB family nuclease
MAVNLESLNFQFANFLFSPKIDVDRPIIQRYLVIFEQGPGHLAGYVPDVPGCVAIGQSMIELREKLHEALESHLTAIAREGKPLPEPSVGINDVLPGTFAELMVVRLRPGRKKRAWELVRPWPVRW